MGRRGGPQIDFQQMMPLTKFVRWLMIVNVAIWFVGILIIEGFMKVPITGFLGLTPELVLRHFFIWQPFTYLFIHTYSPFHIIFNMLLLWWVGSQLELLWGKKFFALFYFVSGVGASILYMASALIFSKSQPEMMTTTVVGAEAALFGLLMAYGIYFGEQVVYFMFFFAMKAKYLVAILVGIEVVIILNNARNQGNVANLAHIGGLITGYVFLKVWPWIGGGQGGSRRKARQNKLRLVVNNDDMDKASQPKYWN